MRKLSGKVAVVTGAASGMGKSIAKLFAAEGSNVIVSDINLDDAAKVVHEITEKGGCAIAHSANVAVEQDVDRLIEDAIKHFGTVDILINNAGIMDNFEPVEDVSDELWDKVLAVNTTGCMRTIRKVIPIFTEKKAGVIVNIASVGGLAGSRAGVAYTASKHALIGITKNVGFQYAKLGIRCNAVAPGGVNTNIGTSLTNPNSFGAENVMAGSGIGIRLGEPEEVAKIALFLASDESSFVNGTVITADAGNLAY
ncbi:SDR family oxidoreductase [Paenibacillus sp. 7523-1]|uniref:SDR family oxidoreductase n=1 Tax=Paenibacillus sp. 7523-1 TaxID=2022550 RepID=UPI0020D00219|nr:SDR family oxidoreductase [Paenibacillus sp. 7523-1]